MAKNKRNRSGNPAAGSNQSIAEVRPAASVAQSTYSVAGSSKGSTAFYTTSWFERLLLAIGSIVSVFALASRFIGVNVSVLKDEYIYVLDAHYKDVSGFRLPNELFQFVYSSTKLCGENFYDCARGINAVFVVAGALIIYFLVKLVTSGKKWLGALAGLATVFGTNGTYAAYFLPEAIFNFVMIGFFFLLIKYGQSKSWQMWIVMGAVFALASLAKPHAFFVLPAVVIYVALAARWSSGNYFLTLLKRAGLLVGTIFSVNISLSWLSQRSQPTDVFGTYGGADRTPAAIIEDSGIEIVTALPGTALGQTLVMVLSIGLALPIAVIAVFSVLRKIDVEAFSRTKAGVLIGLAIANMMAVTAVFEAWIELFTWMHTRYYSYLIPLVLVVLAEAWANRETERSSWLSRIVIGIFTVISGYAFFTTAAPYSTNWVDAPDFKFHIDNPAVSGFLIVATVITGLIYLVHARGALVVGFVVLFAAYLGAGQHITNFLHSNFGDDIVSDDISRILRTALPQDQVDKTVLVGPGPVEMDRVLFGVLSGSNRTYLPNSESKFDLSVLEPDDMWLISLSGVEVDGLGPVAIQGLGYAMYRLSDEAKIESRAGKQFQLSSPCSSADNVGWACGPETSIDWNGEITGGAIIDVIFEVSGDDQEVAFSLGTSLIEGVFSQGTWATTIRVSGEGQAPQLRIISTSENPKVKENDQKLVRVLHFEVHR